MFTTSQKEQALQAIDAAVKWLEQARLGVENNNVQQASFNYTRLLNGDATVPTPLARLAFLIGAALED